MYRIFLGFVCSTLPYPGFFRSRYLMPTVVLTPRSHWRRDHAKLFLGDLCNTIEVFLWRNSDYTEASHRREVGEIAGGLTSWVQGG